MNQLVIVLCGRKQSGKNTTCNAIAAQYLNATEHDGKIYTSDSQGIYTFDTTSNKFTPFPLNLLSFSGIKLYSFADLLKEFCINVLGVSHEQCYGTDPQKDSIVPHLLWENAVGRDECDLDKTGPMSGRQTMQWMGSNVCRKIYGDVWANSTYQKIKKDDYPLSLICDGRFPNEVEGGKEVNAKTIRLLRAVKKDSHISETALDDYPLEKFSLVVDNRKMSELEQEEFIEPFVTEWFKKAGI